MILESSRLGGTCRTQRAIRLGLASWVPKRRFKPLCRRRMSTFAQ
jgi:hypothetical protein